MPKLRETSNRGFWSTQEKQTCEWHTLNDYLDTEEEILLPLTKGDSCVLCNFSEFQRDVDGVAPNALFTNYEEALRVLNKRTVNAWNGQFSGDGLGCHAYFNNPGNERTIEWYIDNNIYSNGLFSLFVAPAGLGKTKFAPSLLANKFSCDHIVLISERVTAIEGAMSWYVDHPLPGVGLITCKAGGKIKTWESKDPKFKRKLFLLTTGAFVASYMNKTKWDRNTLLIIDEAHNLSYDTIRAASAVSFKQIVLCTASPLQDVPVDLTTPLPSKVMLFPNMSSWLIDDVLTKMSRKSALIIAPGRGEVLRIAKDYLIKDFRVFVVYRGATQEMIWEKPEVVYRTVPMSLIVEVTKLDNVVVVATEILQESVTLHVSLVADYGQRFRPNLDISGLQGLKTIDDFSDIINDNLHDQYRDIALHEIVQVAGRVGRTPYSKDGIAIIGRAFPLFDHKAVSFFKDTSIPHGHPCAGVLNKTTINMLKGEAKRISEEDYISRAEATTLKFLNKFLDQFSSGPYVTRGFMKAPIDRFLNSSFRLGGELVRSRNTTQSENRTFGALACEENIWEIRKQQRLQLSSAPVLDDRSPSPSSSENSVSSVKSTTAKSDDAFSCDGIPATSAYPIPEDEDDEIEAPSPLPVPETPAVITLAQFEIYDESVSLQILSRPRWHWLPSNTIVVNLNKQPKTVSYRPVSLNKEFTHGTGDISDSRPPAARSKFFTSDKSRRNRQFKSTLYGNFYCYAYMFKEECRKHATDTLGKLPRIHEVDGYIQRVGGLDEVSCGNVWFSLIKGGMTHVRESLQDMGKTRKNFHLYWQRLVQRFPNVRMGVDLRDENLGTDPLSVRLLELPEDDRYRFLRELADSNPEDLPDTLPDVDEDKEDIVAPSPRFVRAPGDCWKKLRGISTSLSGVDVTVSQILEHEEGILRYNDLIEYSVGDDGDVHIEWSRSRPQRNQLVAERSKKLLAGERNIPPIGKGHTSREFLDFLKNLGDKTVRVSNVHESDESPLEAAIASMHTMINSESIDGLRMNNIMSAMRAGEKFGHWAVAKANQTFLLNWGIPFLPKGAISHPHPVHAIMRRWIHGRELPRVMPDGGDVYFCAPKTLNILESDANKYKLRNAILEAKDIARYPFVEKMSDLIHTKAKKVFFSECAHYFTPGDVLAFHSTNPDVEIAYWSGIVPPESLVCDYSLRPSLYKFTISNDRLMYRAEDDEDEYNQPLAAHWWYTTRSIVSMNTKIIVSREWRKGPFFIMSTTTRSILEEKQRTFADMGFTKLPCDFFGCPTEYLVVPQEIIGALVWYGQGLTNCRRRDIVAQYRRWGDTKYCKPLPVHVEHMVIECAFTLVQQGARVNYDSEFCGMWETLRQKTTGRLWRSTFGKWDELIKAKYFIALNNLQPAIVIDTSVVSLHGACIQHVTHDLQDLIKQGPGSFSSIYGSSYRQNLMSFASKTFGAVWHPTIEVPKRVEPMFVKSTISRPQPLPIKSKCEAFVKVDLSEGLTSMSEAVDHRITISSYDDFNKKQERTNSHHVTYSIDRLRAIQRASEMLRRDKAGDTTGQTMIRDQDCQVKPLLQEVSSQVGEVPTTEVDKTKDLSDIDQVLKDMVKEEALDNQGDIGCATAPYGVPFEQECVRKVIPNSVLMFDHCGKGSICSEHPMTLLSNEANLCSSGFKFTGSHSAPCHACSNVTLTGSKDDVHRIGKAIQRAERAGETEMIITALKKGIKKSTAYTRESWISIKFGVERSQRWNASLLSQPPSRTIISEKPSNDCLLECFSRITNLSTDTLWRSLCDHVTHQTQDDLRGGGNFLSLFSLEVLALVHRVNVVLDPVVPDHPVHYGVKVGQAWVMSLVDNHYSIGVVPIKKKFDTTSDMPHDALKLLRAVSAEYPSKQYLPSCERGEKYMRQVRFGLTGTLLKQVGVDDMKAAEELVAKNINGREVRISFIAGDPGSGKSYSTANFFQDDNWWRASRPLTVITPTSTLKSDWADKMNLSRRPFKVNNSQCCTFEVALLRCNSLVVVIDELSKFPPGYVDALVLLHRNIEHVILLGDPHQTVWHEPNEDCDLNKSTFIEPEADYFSEYITEYFVGTRRLAQQTASVLGLPTTSKNAIGRFRSVDSVDPNIPVIVPTRMAVRGLTEFFGGIATTYTSSQGKDFDVNYAIEITDSVLTHLDRRAIWTAITRGKKDILLIWKVSYEGKHAVIIDRDPLLKRLWMVTHGTSLSELDPFNILDYVGEFSKSRWHTRRLAFKIEETTNFKDLPNSIVLGNEDIENPGVKVLRYCKHLSYPKMTPTGGIRPEHVYKEYLSKKGEVIENLNSLTYSTLAEPIEVAEVPYQQVGLPAIETRDKFLRCEKVDLREMFIGNLLPNEMRELHDKDGFTSTQFPTGAVDRGRIRTKIPGDVMLTDALLNSTLGDPAFYECAHKMSDQDTVSRKAARDKRLRFAAPGEKIVFSKDHDAAQLLFASLKQMLPKLGTVKFDEHNYFEERVLNEQNRFKRKTPMLLANMSDRGAPDYGIQFSTTPNNYVHIGYKNEYKCKPETLGQNAKPLQTLITMHESAFHEMGALFREITRCFLAIIPDEIYVHLGKSPARLNEWVKKHWKTKNGGTCDYSAFDQSQDISVLLFELKVYEYMGVPRTLLERFKRWKMNLICQYGSLEVMRFTGESGTILGNTLANMALSNLERDLAGPRGVHFPCAFIGDDSVFHPSTLPRGTWVKNGKYFKLQPKLMIQEPAEFVGWCLTPDGIFKDPEVLWYRHRLRIEQGRSAETILSYAYEAGFAYRLPNLSDWLTQKRSVCHNQLMRHLLKNRRFVENFGYLLTGDLDVHNHLDLSHEENLSERMQRFMQSSRKDVVLRSGVKALRYLGSLFDKSKSATMDEHKLALSMDRIHAEMPIIHLEEGGNQ